MEKFITIAQNIYDWVVNILFGEIIENEWYTTHLDAIRGVTTVIMCGVVVLFAIVLVVVVARFIGSIISLRR